MHSSPKSTTFAKKVMEHDLLEYVSQRISREEIAQNRRILEVAHELSRSCCIHEKQLCESQQNASYREIEQHVAECYAKEHGVWTPYSTVFELGIPGPSGHENDTYVSNDTIYKVNNLLNSKTIVSLFCKMLCHNILFYDTAYEFYGFTGFEGRSVMPIFTQKLIKDATPATTIEIDTYMSALGFNKMEEGVFSNHEMRVWDVLPRNVLRDHDGDLFVIDAEIALMGVVKLDF